MKANEEYELTGIHRETSLHIELPKRKFIITKEESKKKIYKMNYQAKVL